MNQRGDESRRMAREKMGVRKDRDIEQGAKVETDGQM